MCLRTSRKTRAPRPSSDRCRGPSRARQWTRTAPAEPGRPRCAQPGRARSVAIPPTTQSQRHRRPRGAGAASRSQAPTQPPTPEQRAAPRPRPDVASPSCRCAPPPPGAARAALSQPPEAACSAPQSIVPISNHYDASFDTHERRSRLRSRTRARAAPAVRSVSWTSGTRSLHTATLSPDGPRHPPESLRQALFVACQGPVSSPRMTAIATVPTICRLSALTLSAVSSSV